MNNHTKNSLILLYVAFLMLFFHLIDFILKKESDTGFEEYMNWYENMIDNCYFAGELYL